MWELECFVDVFLEGLHSLDELLSVYFFSVALENISFLDLRVPWERWFCRCSFEDTSSGLFSSVSASAGAAAFAGATTNP